MTEYWKSQAKKFCEFCKCWITDNRASVDFHERGKRHKDNVSKRISEAAKKGKEKQEQESSLASNLKKMEEAAMKAYQRDIAGDALLAAKYNVDPDTLKAAIGPIAPSKAIGPDVQGPTVGPIPPSSDKKKPAGPSKGKHSKGAGAKGHFKKKTPHQPSFDAMHAMHDNNAAAQNKVGQQSQPEQLWVAGLSPEGYPYYWNTQTGESRWEQPADYVPSQDDNANSEQQISVPESHSTVETTGESQEAAAEVPSGEDRGSKRPLEPDSAPQESPQPSKPPRQDYAAPRYDAYGSWTVVKQAPLPQLDLPVVVNKVEESAASKLSQAATDPKPEPVAFKFKEKAITSIQPSATDTTNTGFKKRKTGIKRNLKQREEPS